MDRVDEAFRKMSREDFLPINVKDSADLDVPLPIGFGQTNSQPSTVRMMLEWLNVQQGQKVLDVGYGSGWTTALLSYIVGENGEIIAVERVPELVELGRQNCQKLNIKNAKFYKADEKIGYEKQAPYDRILVSASADNLPDSLVLQLANNGKMVIPVKSSIFILEKNDNGKISKSEHHGFRFVPLL